MSISNKIQIFEEGEIVKLVKKCPMYENEIRFGMIDDVRKDDEGIAYLIDFGSGGRTDKHYWLNPYIRKTTEQEQFLFCTYGNKIDEEKIMKEGKLVKFCKHYVGGQFNKAFRIMSYGAVVYFLLLALVTIICGGIDIVFMGAPVIVTTVGIIAGVSASIMSVIAIFCFFGFLISLLVCEIRGEIIR